MHVLIFSTHEVFLTVDLQHGRGLRLAHAVLRCAGVRPFVLLFHLEQAEVVAIADFKPGSEQNEIMKDLKGQFILGNKSCN